MGGTNISLETDRLIMPMNIDWMIRIFQCLSIFEYKNIIYLYVIKKWIQNKNIDI
jgi:hypothetical protein